MEPVRDILKASNGKNKSLYWDETLQGLFQQSKDIICNEVSKGLAYFNVNKNIIVMTDWSTQGLAFTI